MRPERASANLHVAFRDGAASAPNVEPEIFQTPRSSQDAQPPGEASDGEDVFHEASANLSPSSINSPPYWTAHQRSTSNVSVDSILPAGAITLRDNETNEHNDRNNACWAKSVVISDYTIVNGGPTSIGAFVVWNIKVETLNVSASQGILDWITSGLG
jgi:hypothetical protein